MESPGKNLNIFLGSSDKTRSDIIESASASEKYIIFMNGSLQAENKDLRIKMDSITNERDELLDDNEKFDTSKRYTKGLLKNLVEIEKLHDQVKKIYINIHEKRVQDEKKLLDMFFKSLNVLKIVFSVLFAVIMHLDLINYVYVFSLLFLTIVCILMAESVGRHIRYILSSSYTNLLIDSIRKKESEIKVIKDSQDFLDEYIDNL